MSRPIVSRPIVSRPFVSRPFVSRPIVRPPIVSPRHPKSEIKVSKYFTINSDSRGKLFEPTSP